MIFCLTYQCHVGVHTEGAEAMIRFLLYPAGSLEIAERWILSAEADVGGSAVSVLCERPPRPAPLPVRVRQLGMSVSHSLLSASPSRMM